MKRFFVLALCLLILCPAALAETYVVDRYGREESPGYSMLLRDDGTLLTPIQTYGNIYEITPDGTPEAERLFAVTAYSMDIDFEPEDIEDMLYEMGYVRMALMDGGGRLLTGYDYDGLDYGNGYVVFTIPNESQTVGAMDARGNVVIGPQYAALKSLGDGKWLAVLQPENDSATQRVYTEDGDYYEETSYAMALIDSDGAVRELGLHTRDRYFNVNREGVCAVWNVDEYDGQTVFIDSNGGVMFDRGFQYAENFDGDYAVVEENGRYGVIDKSGAFVLPPEYDYIYGERGKPYIATNGAAFAVYDHQSFEVLTEMDFAPAGEVNVTAISPELLGVSIGERSWIYTTGGDMLMEVPGDAYVQMYGYSGEGINRLVEETGEWPDDMYRLIDPEGNAVSGDYRMLNNGGWQGGHGRFITGSFDVFQDSEGDYLVDWSSYRYGLIDENGATLLPQAYDELRVLSYDRYWAVQGEKSGLIDENGNWYYTISDYETLMD